MKNKCKRTQEKLKRKNNLIVIVPYRDMIRKRVKKHSKVLLNFVSKHSAILFDFFNTLGILRLIVKSVLLTEGFLSKQIVFLTHYHHCTVLVQVTAFRSFLCDERLI